MNDNKELRVYHYQAGEDIFAKQEEPKANIVTATMKDIKAAYDDFMQDLLLESQEAY